MDASPWGTGDSGSHGGCFKMGNGLRHAIGPVRSNLQPITCIPPDSKVYFIVVKYPGNFLKPPLIKFASHDIFSLSSLGK